MQKKLEQIYAYDLWISQKENAKRFSEWGISEQVIPICGDANNLHIYFDEKQFNALISIDSYHYFGSKLGFFQQRILPFMKDDSAVLIGIPGVKEEYADRCEELLSDWVGDYIYMFKSPKVWEELIGRHERIESVITWEMECFEEAWKDWITSGNEHASDDLRYYETIIRPYICFVGIYVKIK
ncbi:SAM-dependent methyltransferase [Fervidobacterium sp.]